MYLDSVLRIAGKQSRPRNVKDGDDNETLNKVLHQTKSTFGHRRKQMAAAPMDLR